MISNNADQSARRPLKIAIFSPYATVSPHFGTDLDIAQQHLDAGDDVEFFSCTGGLKNCDHNPDHLPDLCQACVGRREMGVELLDSASRCYSFVDSASTQVKNDFESVDKLIGYRIENFEIGYAALSSFVSLYRDPEPDLVKHREMLNRFLASAWQTYQQSLEYLNSKQVDRVYVFNGRFASMRAVLRACQRVGVDCHVHERGCNGDHYDLFKNHLLHEIDKIEPVIQGLWDQASNNPDREEIAGRWFHERVNRVESTWHSFVKNQQSGRLPDGWNPEEKNIAIFCSSDDEFVAIGDSWKNDLYPNQCVGIARIAADLAKQQPETKIYLRVHPNLTQVDNQRKRDMMSLDFANLTVIPPAAAVDSYELIRASDTIVTFGSSVGSEAVYWGKPSVLLGPCFYENLGGVYRAKTHEQTIELLKQTLEPQEKTGALKYGFWLQTRGYPHQYFRSNGLFDGQFKGETIYARPQKLKPLARLKKNAKRAWSAIVPGGQPCS